MLKKTLDMLGQAPLMKDLAPQLVGEIAAAGRSRVLKGRFGRIDREELSRRLFFVLSGEMRMLRTAPDGQECLIQRFLPGEFFCLSSILSGHPCHSVMVSAGTSELLHWNHEFFRSHMQGDQHFYGNLLHQMAYQIEQEREMRTLSRCCKADIKVAAYLLHKARSGIGGTPYKNAVIDLKPISLTAQELGIARETLSRCLQRLVRQNGITYQRGQVRISDLASLEAVIEDADCNCSCL